MRFEFCNHGVVLAGIGQNNNVLPVFSGTANHGRATDVDVFDGIFQRTAGFCHGGLKGIKVNHQQINGRDAVGG